MVLENGTLSNGAVEKGEELPPKVAVVFPLSVDRVFCEENNSGYQLHMLYPEMFPDCCSDPKGQSFAFDLVPTGFNMLRYIECCAAYLAERDIRAVVAMNDLSALAAAAVAEVMRRTHGVTLHAPTVQAALLCAHKLRTREVLDPDPITFWSVKVEDMKAAEPKVFPCFVKPTAVMGSFGIFPINSKLDMAEAQEFMQENLKGAGEFLLPYLKHHANLSDEEIERIDPSKVVLCEQLMHATQNVFIDGSINSNGDIHIWTIVDNNYHKKAKFCFKDHSVPSRLYKDRPDIIAAIKSKILSIAKGMVSKGFKSSFFSMEFFINFDEDNKESEHSIKLIEINGRMSTPMAALYQMLGLDMMSKQVSMSLGRPTPPCLPARFDCAEPELGFGALVYLSVFVGDDDDGVAAEKVLDFQAVKDIEREEKDVKVALKVSPGDRLGKSCQRSGTRLGYMSFVGPSREANNLRSIQLLKRMLKRPDLAPWHPKFEEMP